jgi:hypothetical protein
LPRRKRETLDSRIANAMPNHSTSSRSQPIGFGPVNRLRVLFRARTCAPFRWLPPPGTGSASSHPLWLSSRPYASELHPSHPRRPTSSPAMASAAAASTATRFLPQLSAPWLRRARVALLPSPLPWRSLAVTVAAAERRPGAGEGGRRGRTRRRSAKGAEQEEGVSLSSGDPLPPPPAPVNLPARGA